MKWRPSDLLVLRLGLSAGDALVLVLAVWLSSGVRYGFDVWPGGGSPIRLAAVPIVLALFWVQRLYDEDLLLGGAREYSRAITACTYGALAMVAFSFVAGGTPIVSREWVIVHWLISAGLLCQWRFIARRLAGQLRRRGRLITPLIIVGASDQGASIARQLDTPTAGTRVVGFLDDYLPIGALVTTTRLRAGGEPHELRVLGGPENLRQIVRRHGVREIVVIPHALSWESHELIVRQAALSEGRPRVRITPGLYDGMALALRTLPRGGVPLLALERARIRGLDRVLKGALDRGVAAAALLVLSPLVVGLIAVGRITGQRPVIERRLVVGLGGRPRPLYLFGPWLSGHLLLHGLPALLGVLRGHLSLVGPRPGLAGAAQDWSDARHTLSFMKPGLTGPWRLRPVDDLKPAWDEDLWYLRNYSIWEDVRILVQTMMRAARQRQQSDGKIGRWHQGLSTHERSIEERVGSLLTMATQLSFPRSAPEGIEQSSQDGPVIVETRELRNPSERVFTSGTLFNT